MEEEMTKSKASGGGGKKRKTGDWEKVASGRKNKDLEVTTRGNRDMPLIGVTGSAAYQRMMGKGK